MRRIMNLHPGAGETLSLLAAGVILGVAIGASGCARADKTPVLPAARVDWTKAAAGPRQVTVSGELRDVDRRANALMLDGWRIVPGSAAMAALPNTTLSGATACAAMLVLEQKPKKATP